MQIPGGYELGQTSFPRFCIITATFNRASTLPRLYASLNAQQFRNFEWIIVDDGSTDATESLVSDWPGVKYLRKQNGGKHTAINMGFKNLCTSEYVMIVDSDDELESDALQTIAEFAADNYPHLNVLARRPDGSPIGKDLPAESIHAETFKEQFSYRWSDRLDIVRSDVFEHYPYPEYGEQFVPDGLIWNRMAKRFPTRFINKRLLIVHQSELSMSNSNLALRMSSPRSSCLYYWELFKSTAPSYYRARAFINWMRFRLAQSLREANTA